MNIVGLSLRQSSLNSRVHSLYPVLLYSMEAMLSLELTALDIESKRDQYELLQPITIALHCIAKTQ